MIVPSATTENRPSQQSESKAQKIGNKFVKALHRNITMAAVAGSK